MTDPMTGLDYYHNRLSGKTQKNRPIGIKDTELDIEYI